MQRELVMVVKMGSGDRRFDDRHPGTGLIAKIEDYEVDVIDVSIGGLKFIRLADKHYYIQNTVAFELVSMHWPDLKPAFGNGLVRAAHGNWVALQFVRPTYDLMKCVSRHVGTLLWGGQPYGY